MVYNSNGCLIPNTKSPLERIILHLRNGEIQNKKFNFILYKLTEWIPKEEET